MVTVIPVTIHGHCGDSAVFWKSYSAVVASQYIASCEDILRSQSRTTGIRCTTLDTCHVIFQIHDLGVVRSERKKWIHCLDFVDSLVFTVDSSAYCRPLMEDETSARTV